MNFLKLGVAGGVPLEAYSEIEINVQLVGNSGMGWLRWTQTEP